MANVMLALMRMLASLRNRKVWGYVLAPALFSLLLWIGLAFWGLGVVVDWLLGHPPMTILTSWGVAWLAHILAYLGGWMAIFAGAYVTASLLAALFVMPLLLKHLANNEYREVAAMGKDSFVAAGANSVLAAVLFVAGWVLTLPLWIIPGLSLLIPLLLMAWLNRRTFAYDALSLHATTDEWREIRRQHKRPLLMLGLTMALLAHVPLVGLLVPALAALAFAHFGLQALSQLRGGALLCATAERGDD